MQSDSSSPLWLPVAAEEIGQLEIVGPEHNKRILEYHSKTMLKSTTDEVAWCSAFVNWVFWIMEMQGTASPLARSWLAWGVKLAKPKHGCVVILKRGKAWQGHVGFWLGNIGKYVIVLGGNQKNRVWVDLYPRKQIIGFRWPAVKIPA